VDEFNNLIDTGRFLKLMADIETGKDQPEPHKIHTAPYWLEDLSPEERLEIEIENAEFLRDQIRHAR